MHIFWESVGYIGTALVLISMAMTSVTRLRIINMSGSLLSMIYAIHTGTFPVVLLNAGLILINGIQVARVYVAAKKGRDGENADVAENAEIAPKAADETP